MKLVEAKAMLDKKRPYVKKRFLKSRNLILEVNPRIVLDVGCGDTLLLSLCGDKLERHGVDILEKNEQNNNNIVYKKHDITKNFPYENDKFDVVHSSEVIEHVKDTLYFLRECMRVLKPEGRLIISTPNLHYWRNIIEWFKGRQFHFVDYHNEQEGHMRYFCPKTLHELANKAGFTNINTATLGDWGEGKIVIMAVAKIFEKFFRQKNLILFMTANKNS
jgi:2-polyprenyl-3-methyl-5-hydroxy-6-metoxy-1,4-benzoquinol methylase